MGDAGVAVVAGDGAAKKRAAGKDSRAWPSVTTVKFVFPDATAAHHAVAVVSVDHILNSRVAVELAVEDTTVVATFKALETRYLRATLCAFMDMMTVVVRTLRDFGSS